MACFPGARRLPRNRPLHRVDKGLAIFNSLPFGLHGRRNSAMEVKTHAKWIPQTLSPPPAHLLWIYSFALSVNDCLSWANPRPICGTVKSHLRATCGIRFRVVSRGTVRVALSYDSSLRWHVGCRIA